MGMSVYHIKYTREKGGGGLENEDDVRKLSGYNFTLGVDMFATIWTGPARVWFFHVLHHRVITHRTQVVVLADAVRLGVIQIRQVEGEDYGLKAGHFSDDFKCTFVVFIVHVELPVELCCLW